MSDLSLLDNIVWNALTGPQAKFATGSGAARRFAPGISPIVGFENATDPDFDALSPYCEAEQPFYCMVWQGTPPTEWRVDVETSLLKMVWDADVPSDDAAPDAIALRPEHAQQALDLALLTRPGPFGLRTPELGEYFGYLEGDRLIAMAGERFHAGDLREISGVCTHPDDQGHGMARRLMLKLVRRQLSRGECPFLHVMSQNHGAIELYKRLGFRSYREVPVRVVCKRAAA